MLYLIQIIFYTIHSYNQKYRKQLINQKQRTKYQISGV